MRVGRDELILEALRTHRGDFVSGEELSKSLGVSRAAIWKEIEALRSMGYVIQAETHKGYQLSGLPDRLLADELRWRLGTRCLGQKIYSYDDLDSTNDTVFRMGEEGAEEGVVVFAEHQKKGRGRLGRHWLAPKGRSILFSYLLRPTLEPMQISRITLVTAVSIARTVRAFTGKKPGIKWPNDIYYQNKKLCGILTEMSSDADRVRFVVVGVGINVNSSSEDLPSHAISLKDIAGEKVSRLDFARELLRNLDEDYHTLSRGGFESLLAQWEDYSMISGKRVVAKLLDREVEGTVSGVDPDGALWIRMDNGLQERIISGDIQQLRA